MSWRVLSIGDFLNVRKDRYKPITANSLGLKRIEKIDFSGQYHLVEKPTNTDMILVRNGDLLISGINAEKGAVTVYREIEDALATIHYSSYEFDEAQIYVEYFRWFLKSDAFKSLLRATAGNGIKTELKPKHILPLKISLPDLNEQRRIVKEIINKNIKLEEVISEINSQLSNIQLLRQAILQEAVQGKLVPQDPTDEPATELLKRIKAEKAKQTKKGKTETYEPINDVPYEIPDGWAWCRLGELGQINPRNDCDDNLEVSFIPMSFISSVFGVEPEMEVRKWKELKGGFTHFANDDVAFAKITPCFENSKAAIFKKLKNGIGAGTTELHVFRGNTRFILPEYVYLFFKSPKFLLIGESKMTGSAGQKRVPTDFVKNIEFSLAPLNEQKRIVTKVQQLMQLCDELEAQVQQSKADAEKLLQAVLREAFEGNKTYKTQDAALSLAAEP